MSVEELKEITSFRMKSVKERNGNYINKDGSIMTEEQLFNRSYEYFNSENEKKEMKELLKKKMGT